MGVAKGYKNNINVRLGKIGFARRKEILHEIIDKGTYLPKGIDYEDMDETFVDFITNDERMGLIIDGEKVPVIFLTIQRWTEFSKTWQFADKYKNIELPFITIVRKPDIQVGTNQQNLWNIPGRQTYTFMKVPTWDGVRNGVDLYKIPQPTSVDITYEVRLFTNRMKDLNKFNVKIQTAFHSRQCYINPKGHPMPLHLESIGDESNIDDFENRRFYVQLFEMKLLGYILNEEDYEVVPTVNRTLLTMEVSEKLIGSTVIFEPKFNGNIVTYNFVWKPKTEMVYSFTATYSVNFTQLTNIVDISRITIGINSVTVFDGTVLTSPIIINSGDNVSITIYKTYLDTGMFQLIGNTI